jgi:hypothetical protein
VNGLGGIAQVPYRLHDLVQDLTADRTVPVFVPEGEGKVDLLRQWGLTATYIAKGTSGFAEHFRDAVVILLPDADKPGHDYVDRVASELRGVAREVRVLALSGRPDSGDDIEEWAAAGGTVERLLQLVESDAVPWAQRTDDLVAPQGGLSTAVRGDVACEQRQRPHPAGVSGRRER